MIARIGFVVAVIALFVATLAQPPRPAEATAALAVVDACHTGNAIASHRLGEHEPRRLPLQTWILSGLAWWRAEEVDVRVARGVSFAALLLSAVAAAAALGSKRRTTVALILVTPAIWDVGTRGSPGAVLAFLIVLAWACHEAGRRIGAPTLQWALPPILGAAASLVWSPAILLVAFPLLVESLWPAGPRRVSWFRLALGALASVGIIALWQIADAGFAGRPLGWIERMGRDLWPGDPLLALRGWRERLAVVAGVMVPAVLLAVVGGWPRRVLAPVSAGLAGPCRGVRLAAALAVAWTIVAPGTPPAVAVPAAVIALGFLGTRKLLDGPPERSRRTEAVAVAVLLLWVAAAVVHHPRGTGRFDTAALAAIGEDAPVVIDRALDVEETWAVVSALGRPGARSAQPGQTAWYVAHAAVGPGLRVDGPQAPEGWSLLGRPLEIPTLPDETRAAFERALDEALEAYREAPRDALASIWVGRRLAYLGRYREAIDWYGEALRVHPDDARLWRHRGHRFISLRELDLAIRDLRRASELEQGNEDRIEPDGLPNAAGIPRSTTQGNIWYHLGLAYYLKGDLENTARCYRRCIELSTNDDTWVASAHWLHVALRRLGRRDEADELLSGLRDDMEILENDSYHDLVRLYAGRIDATELQQRLDAGDGPSQAALAYGLARWYDDRGDAERARAAYRKIVAEAPWAAFGAIAAEAELAAMLERERPIW